MNLSLRTGALVVAATVLLAATQLCAQTDYSERATNRMSIGLGYAAGASIMPTAPTNWKTGPGFAFRTGLDVTYPFSESYHALLELGLDSRVSKLEWFNDATLSESRRVNYLSITPALQFNAFYLGVNIGIPMSGQRTYQNGADATSRTVDLDTKADSLSTLIEPRIGAVIQLFDSRLGWAGLTVAVGYGLTKTSESSMFMPGGTSGTAVSQNTASGHIGLTWQFGVGSRTYK